MNGVEAIAKFLILVGVAIVIVGLAVLLLWRIADGKGAPLPGDIVIRRDNLTVYFPIVTCLVVSVILTLLFFVVAALRR